MMLVIVNKTESEILNRPMFVAPKLILTAEVKKAKSFSSAVDALKYLRKYCDKYNYNASEMFVAAKNKYL